MLIYRTAALPNSPAEKRRGQRPRQSGPDQERTGSREVLIEPDVTQPRPPFCVPPHSIGRRLAPLFGSL
jgi:hypothetical protein